VERSNAAYSSSDSGDSMLFQREFMPFRKIKDEDIVRMQRASGSSRVAEVRNHGILRSEKTVLKRAAP
jgi:hypothetical protein